MLSEEAFVERPEINPACTAALERAIAACEVTLDATCCALTRNLWVTFAGDGAVCVCNEDFGSYPTVQVATATSLSRSLLPVG